MTDTNEKLRALFLTALMVLSVFAGTIALSGSAAAAANTFADSDADQALSSNGTYWQGQELWLEGTAGETWELRRVDTSGDNDAVGGLVQQVVFDSNGTATIDTSNLDGTYVLEDESNGLVSYDDGVVQSQSATLAQADWEVAVQTLSASFDEDDVPTDTGSSATIDVDSNRGVYQVNVTAEGLDEEDLEMIFNQSDDGNAFVAGSGADDDDSVQLNISGSSDTVEANFTEFDEAGSYTFDFEVSDTTASASASVEVAEEDVDLNFAQSIITQEEGDWAAITVTYGDTDDAYIYVGGEDVNYLERVHLVDDDGDGQATVIFNTFSAGRNLSTLPGIDATFTLPDGSDDEIAGTERYTRADFGNEMDEVSLQNATLSDPLEPADYGLSVTAEGASLGEDDVNDDGDIVIPDEEDVATLDLTERSTDGIKTWVAPTGAADIDPDDAEDVSNLLNSVTPSDTVAIGDRLIVQVNASGIFGYVSDDSGNGLGSVYDGNSPYGVYLNITSVAGSNQASSSLSLSGDEAQLITPDDPASNTMFLVVDTRGLGLDDGDDYEVSFQVGNEEQSSSPNPYVDDDEEQRVETEVTFQSNDASFNNVQDGDLQVEQSSDAMVSGTTNAAPGEELSIRLRKTGESPFLMTQTVVVQSDGSFNGTFDTSAIPVDTTFTASVREGGDVISDDVDGVIVESVTPTPETTTAPPETTTAPPETTTAPPETTMAPTETESPGQPGFGVAIAILALLGAALLALRRRD